MSNEQMIRYWKDAEYRDALAAPQREAMGENPAGILEVPDDLLAGVGGREGEDLEVAPPVVLTSIPCLGVLSTAVSCLNCEHSMWHGTCYASTIGCCPPQQ